MMGSVFLDLVKLDLEEEEFGRGCSRLQSNPTERTLAKQRGSLLDVKVIQTQVSIGQNAPRI